MIQKLVQLSKSCAKLLLVVLNGLCMLIGIIIFAFAVADTRILQQYGDEYAGGTFAGDMVIITVSIMLVSVAILGLVGAVGENVKMLYLYVGFLMILVVLELLTGVFVAVQRYGVEIRVTEWLREDFFRNLTGEPLLLHEKQWDEIQTKYECCGLNGPEDYSAIQREVSLSCCPRAYRARTALAQTQLFHLCKESASYYSSGCEDEILFVLRDSSDWLLGVAVISFWFEATGMLLAMWVANNVKNSVQVYKHTVKY